MNLIDFQQDTLERRRPAGVGNRFFRATDIDVCFFDDGFVWFPLVGGTVAEVTTTESIPPYSAVTAYGTQASSDNPNDQYKIIGVTVIAIPQGTTASLLTVGRIQNGLWNWMIGDIIYLNGTSFSNIAPTTGFIQQIGVAVAPDIIQLGFFAQVSPVAIPIPAFGTTAGTITEGNDERIVHPRRLLCANGQVLVGNNHALWGPER